MNHYFGVHVLDGDWHSLLPRYLLLAERVRGKRVLDLGCGTGIGTSFLLELGAERVDGVDRRPERLELARIKHDKAALRFHHVSRWHELDFADDTFDLTLCLDPGLPVTEPALLGQARRVLRGDGSYVCAIERRTVDGLESLLPREQDDRSVERSPEAGGDDSAPQIGELSHRFETCSRVRQRPTYTYTFEPETLWNRSGDGRAPAPQEDETFCVDEPGDAGVELIFCGPEEMPSPPHRAVELPYYRLVERIREHLASKASQREETTAVESVASVAERSDGAHLESPVLDRLNEMLQQTQTRLLSIQRETRAFTRDQRQFFDILASALEQSSESRSFPAAPTTEHELDEETSPDLADEPSPASAVSGGEPASESDPDETTRVEGGPTAPPDDTGTDAELDRESALEQKIAQLEDRQRRLRDELEARESYIRELRGELDEEQAGDEPTDDEASETAPGTPDSSADETHAAVDDEGAPEDDGLEETSSDGTDPEGATTPEADPEGETHSEDDERDDASRDASEAP